MVKICTHLVIFTGECWRLICIPAIHGIGEHNLHVVRQSSMGEWLGYAMFPA